MARRRRRSKQFKDSSKIIDMEQARQERQRARKKAEARQQSQTEVSPEIAARQSSRKLKLRRRKQIRRRVIFGVLALVLIIGAVSFGRIVMLKHELRQAEKQQKIYQKEKEQLEKEMEEINDLDHLEEQARDQMRLIKPGETLYIFPENTAE